jgi:hypothetical protein
MTKKDVQQPSKKKVQQVPETKQQQLAVAAPSLLPTTSEEALDQHLAEWGGSGGRLFAFNGSTGIHRTLDDDIEVPDGTEFVAFLHETQRGHIKFNEGGPPDARMVRIDQVAETSERSKLGDNDPTQWPLGLDGNPTDPWKEQFAIPMARNDAGGELYVLVARGVVAMNSVRSLLGRWRLHPKRREGLIPVIQVKNGTYFNKRFNDDRPKPEYVIVGWATKTGASPPESASTKQIEKPSLSEELNDEIGF